jgi:hypothetical protein
MEIRVNKGRIKSDEKRFIRYEEVNAFNIYF